MSMRLLRRGLCPNAFRRLFVVRHYQTHLARRRTMRPQEEYRPVTDTEWQEFDEQFDKRKLEPGNCGRPYATPCSHEHACIRCPMLHVDPKMLGRLAEIEPTSSAAASVPNPKAGSVRSRESTSLPPFSTASAKKPSGSLPKLGSASACLSAEGRRHEPYGHEALSLPPRDLHQ
ncbi:integrase [Embleya hyalina]|uniref:Integrase n=1 Tax=Embleya hyalina TaxID=516124 RepID=A0A401YJA3_9ACTN|nr:integrase [Embleya hyalina]